MKPRYPELKAIGCPVKKSRRGYDYVRGADLTRAMRTHKGDHAAFDRAFGVNTCPAEGMFAWDVEAALRRARTGEKQHWAAWD